MTDAHLITNPHGRTVAVTSEWVRENQRVLSSGPWRFVTRAVPGSAGVPPASSQSSLPGAPANTSPRVSTARHHPGTAGVLTCFEKSVRPADIVRARTRPVIVHILPWTLATGGAQRFILML
ncbi:hypothetical protein K8I61_18875, partial [bacterium]|nr:hypothetical protein [bacterium]